MALAVVVVVVLAQRSAVVRREARAVGRRVLRRHAHFVAHVFADHFQRGNLHTHSTRSDGTATIEAMVGWYKGHGYQFVAMTEHNLRVPPAELEAFVSPGFVVIPGEEVTDYADKKPLHVNALCGKQAVRGGDDFGRADLGLAIVLGQVRASGAVPLINHPNFHWTLTTGDIGRGAGGRYLLEIWSAHPNVNAMGDALHPSEEDIWDELLAGGRDAVPVAVDDAHALPAETPGGGALPGRGWVETFGEQTTVTGICDALAAGDLYASNGPALAKLAVDGDSLAITTTDPGVVVTFIGELGEILSETRAVDVPTKGDEREVVYRLVGGETLVRARVTDALGRHAWTPAYRVEG